MIYIILFVCFIFFILRRKIDNPPIRIFINNYTDKYEVKDCLQNWIIITILCYKNNKFGIDYGDSWTRKLLDPLITYFRNLDTRKTITEKEIIGFEWLVETLFDVEKTRTSYGNY